VDTHDHDGNTALIAASRWGTPDMVALLLGRGAEVNARNSMGDTALIAAARGGQTEAVRLLIGKRATSTPRTGRATRR